MRQSMPHGNNTLGWAFSDDNREKKKWGTRKGALQPEAEWKSGDIWGISNTESKFQLHLDDYMHVIKEKKKSIAYFIHLSQFLSSLGSLAILLGISVFYFTQNLFFFFSLPISLPFTLYYANKDNMDHEKDLEIYFQIRSSMILKA